MKRTIGGMFLLLVALVLVSCSSMYKSEDDSMMMKEEKGEMMMEAKYMDVGAEEAYKMLMEMPEIFVIDVSPIYDKGHLPNAINAPVGDGSLDMMLKEWDKEATYLVYCHADAPSILGAQKLVEAGFKNVYRLEGNYAAWVEMGYPVEK